MSIQTIIRQYFSGLVLGLAAMLSITALFTMMALTLGLGSIQKDLEQVLGIHLEKVGLAVEMRTAARNRTIIISNMLIMTDPFEQDRQYLEFNHHGAEFAKARARLLAMTLDQTEREIIQHQGKATSLAVAVQNDIIDLIYADEIEIARTLLIDSAIPLQNKVMDQLALLHRHQQLASEKAINKTETNYRQTRIWILAISVCAALLGID